MTWEVIDERRFGADHPWVFRASDNHRWGPLDPIEVALLPFFRMVRTVVHIGFRKILVYLPDGEEREYRRNEEGRWTRHYLPYTWLFNALQLGKDVQQMKYELEWCRQFYEEGGA